MRLTFQEYYNSLPRELIQEGGAYGHMANVHERWDLTFWDLKRLIYLGCKDGVSKEVKEKTDGQALAFSYVFSNPAKLQNPKIIFARNAGHYRQFGKDGLKGSKGVAEKFFNHSAQGVRDAFTFAAKDLEAAFDALPPEDLMELFGNGSRFVNLEIIWPENENVIPYGDHQLLVLHNYREYDEQGNTIAGDFNDYGAFIAQKLKETNLDVQKRFKITSMPMLKIPTLTNHEQHIERLTDPINNILRTHMLNDDNQMIEYWIKHFTDMIRQAAADTGYNIDSRLDLVNQLAWRWACKPISHKPVDLKTKTFQTITKWRKELPRDPTNPEPVKAFINWVNETDKNIAVIHAQMVEPIQHIFGELGMLVIQTIDNLLTMNPSAAGKKIKMRLKQAIDDAQHNQDPVTIKKIDTQLNRILKLGGIDNIVPTEGITFTYTPRGKTEPIIFKYTGNFAPVNQLLGIATYGR